MPLNRFRLPSTRSWRFRFLAGAVTVAALPGLVGLWADPVLAGAASSAGAAVNLPVDVSGLQTPVQVMGSARHLASLVPAGAVASSGPGRGWGPDREAPEGAVPREKRLPAGKIGSDTGQVQAGEASAESRSEASGTVAALAAAPSIVDIYPKPGFLVDSLRPVLRAWGESTGGGGMSYSFRVCAVESMSGSSCTSSGFLSGNRNSWTVPSGELEWGTQYWWRVTVRDSSFQSTTSPTLTFTTGVRQPVVTSHLADRGAGGREFDPQSGNYTTTVTDVSVPVAGPPLSVTRTYNSMDPRTDGIFGAGWSTRWDMKVLKEVRGSSTSALVTYPDGSQVRFKANGDGSFQPPPGMYATLAEQSGGTWKLMDKSATVYEFDAQGRLTKVTDPRNRAQVLTYGVGGKLETVTGTGGRALHFTFSGDHVSSVSTDAVDGSALSWTYTYDGNRLAGVCTPVAAPNCTTYAYGTGSQYRSSVLNSDPFGYWRLGETSGTEAADLGSGAGKGTYQSVTLGQPGALSGTPDTAAGFGAGKVLKLPPNTIPHLGDQMSVETWFKTSASGVLVAAGTQETSGVARGPMLYVGTDGKLRGALDAASSPITSTGTVNDDAWHHVVLTVAGAEQKLYLDGQQVGTRNGTVGSWRRFATVGNGVTSSSTSPSVPSGTAAFPFQGTIDEVAVYGHPLTEAEVGQHYAARAQAENRLTQVTLPSGRVWAANTYDGRTDRLHTHTDRHGGTWTIGDLEHDAEFGEAEVTVTDPHDETLVYLYDAWRGFRLRGETDQLDQTAWFEYDQGGFLSKVIDRNDIANEIYQDKRGNTIGRQYCRAPGECAIESWSYHLNKSDQFDPRNDALIAYRDGRSNSENDNTYRTRFEYNSFGELTKQTTPATSDFPSGRSTTFVYTDGTEATVGGGTTPAGLLKTKTAPNNAVWSYRYNATGDMAEQVEPEGLTTTFTYDVIGRLTAKTELLQGVSGGVTTSFTYDGLGRLTSQTGPGVHNAVADVTHTAKVSYTYDADGNKTSQTVADLTGGDPDRTTTFTYDTFGRLATTTDPEGGVTSQEWNHRGWVTRTTDPRGAVIDQAYSKRGEPTIRTLKGWTGSPVDPQPAADVVLESRSYDNGGRLTGTVDAMNRKTVYAYWMDNRLRTKTADDAKLNGSATPRDVELADLEYDPAGNMIVEVVGGGTVATEYDYDPANRLTAKTLDPSGLARRTEYKYDAVDNPTEIIRTGAGSGRTEITRNEYNKLGLPTKETVENGATDLVSTVGYDQRGLPTTIVDPRGNASGATAADYTTTLQYDVLGRLIEKIDPPVQVDKVGNSATAQPITRYGYNTFGDRTHDTDPEGRTVTTAFDKAGREITITAPAYTPPGGSTITPAIVHVYDDAGQLISTTDPRGNTTSFEYDKLGRRVRVTDPAPPGETPGRTTLVYDHLGELLASVDQTGARKEATFDDLGRKITETVIERVPVAAAYTTRLQYNDAGYLTKSIAPGNATTSYTVNPAGETTEQTDPLNHTTVLNYDLAGRLSKVTDPQGNATTSEYDLAGRRIESNDLNTSGTSLRAFKYGYDLAGNQSSVTSPEGHVTQYFYDALNRLTSQIEPVSASESISTSFGYDAAGARTRITDGRGNATWITYNTLDLPETLVEPATAAHPDPADRTWTTIYDAAGNPTATIQPGNVRIDRVFDHLNRPTNMTGTGAEAATAARTSSYDLAGRVTTIGDYSVEYNDRGQIISISKGGIQQATYGYDGRGNPTQRVDASGIANFTWDSADRLATATDPLTASTLTYGYDNANRIKSITATSGFGGSQTFDYDEMDRLTRHTLKSAGSTQLAQITYGWDKDDNLTTKTTTGTAGAGTNTYAYDRSGRLTSWTASGGTTTDYEWDASGNRIKAGAATFTYDERNRLLTGDGATYTYKPRGTVATETKGGTTRNLAFDAFDQLITDGELTYTYDALGRMTSRTKASAIQNFLYSGLENNVAAITDGIGTIQAKYARDVAGDLLSLQEGTTALAAMTDLHGDLIATYTGTALVDSAAYDPFGKVAAQTGVTRTLGYQGEYTDPDTGKVNMMARWYRPGTGTFISRDTITLNPNPSVKANRYTYANASPLTGTDPTGHETFIDRGDASSYYGIGDNGYVPCDARCQQAPDVEFTREDYVTRDGYVVITEEDGWTTEDMIKYGVIDTSGWLNDEEAKRLGYMSNGRPIPKGVDFWNSTTESQDAFMVTYEVLQMYRDTWNDEEMRAVGKSLGLMMESDRPRGVCGNGCSAEAETKGSADKSKSAAGEKMANSKMLAAKRVSAVSGDCPARRRCNVTYYTEWRVVKVTPWRAYRYYSRISGKSIDVMDLGAGALSGFVVVGWIYDKAVHRRFILSKRYKITTNSKGNTVSRKAEYQLNIQYRSRIITSGRIVLTDVRIKVYGPWRYDNNGPYYYDYNPLGSYKG